MPRRGGGKSCTGILLINYEARILNKPGDHPSPPLLVGECTERTHYRLIIQFHRNQQRTSFTTSTVLSKKRILDKMTWTRIIAKTAGGLASIHEKGFLHNDVTSNNIVIDNRDGVYNPVVIDFGESVPISGARRPKSLSGKPPLKGNKRENSISLHQKLPVTFLASQKLER